MRHISMNKLKQPCNINMLWFYKNNLNVVVHICQSLKINFGNRRRNENWKKVEWIVL